jgi:Ca2+:H+ antiporter
MVIIGWIMGHPMTLLFDPLESVVLYFSVVTVNYAVADGKGNWLKGAILICLYVMVAIIFWYYPGMFSISVRWHRS